MGFLGSQFGSRETSSQGRQIEMADYKSRSGGRRERRGEESRMTAKPFPTPLLAPPTHVAPMMACVTAARGSHARARSLFWFWGGRSRVQPPTSDPSTLITFSTRLDTKVDAIPSTQSRFPCEVANEIVIRIQRFNLITG